MTDSAACTHFAVRLRQGRFEPYSTYLFAPDRTLSRRLDLPSRQQLQLTFCNIEQ